MLGAIRYHRHTSQQQKTNEKWWCWNYSSSKDFGNQSINKGLANTKRPCDCSLLCLRPKSSLCSCPHCILDITSFSSADSMCRASKNRVDQFNPILQVEGNTFHPVFFGYFIADWLRYNSADGSFHTTKLGSRHYSIETEFYSEKLRKSVFEPAFGRLRGNVYIPSIACLKALLDFLFAIIEFVCYRYCLLYTSDAADE